MHPSSIFPSEAFGAKETSPFITNPSPFGRCPPLHPVVPASSSEPVFGASSKLQFVDSMLGSTTTSAPLFGCTISSSWNPAVSTSQCIPVFPCFNGHAATKPSFWYTAAYPHVTPTSGAMNPFETNSWSSGAESSDSGKCVANNQCGGSRIVHYVPTYVESNQFGEPTDCKLASISAMHAYNNKSHEELRIEDYQLRNTVNPFALPSTSGMSSNPSAKCGLFHGAPPNYEVQSITPAFGFNFGSSPFVPSSSNQQPSSLYRMNSPKRDLLSQIPRFGEPYNPGFFGANGSSSSLSTTSLPGFSQNTGPSSSQSQDTGFGSSCTCNKSNAFAEMRSGFTGPTGPSEALPIGSTSGAQVNPATSTTSQSISTGFGAQLFGLGEASKSSFAYPFMNYIAPATGPCWPVGGTLGPTMCSSAFFNQIYPWVPTIWAPFICIIPAIGSNGLPPTDFTALNGLDRAQSTAPTSVPIAPNEVPNRPSPFGSPIGASECPSVLEETDQVLSTKSESVTNFADDQREEKANDDSSIPKGLEIIVEQLGVKPWAKASDGKGTSKDCTQGWRFLPCEEADKDEDIISLAEFAVEQHNAMNKNSKMNLSRVIGACLEAVHNGRYHIALETKDETRSSKPLRFYAVVLQRRTDHQTLMLLEKWLPGEPKSIEDTIDSLLYI